MAIEQGGTTWRGGPLFEIGEIKIFPEWTVTPTGTVATKDLTLTIENESATVPRTPGWAILLGILTCWTLLGLLFFLIKQGVTEGTVKVTVWSGGRFIYASVTKVLYPRDVRILQEKVAGVQNHIAQAALMAQRASEVEGDTG